MNQQTHTPDAVAQGATIQTVQSDYATAAMVQRPRDLKKVPKEVRRG